MTMRSRLSFLLAGLSAAPAMSPAQTAPAYAPSADTVFVENLNPHLMYWIVDGDTLGKPIESVSVERQLWSPVGEHLQVTVFQQTMLPERSETIDTFLVEPNGKLVSSTAALPA